MTRSRFNALAASMALVALASVSHAQGTCTIDWARPDTVRTDRGTRVFVSQPQVVPVRRGTLLLGELSIESTDYNIVLARPGTTSIHYAGVLIRPDGRAEMVAPPDSNRMGLPRAVRIGEDRAAVVWADIDTSYHATGTFRTAEVDSSGWRDPAIVLEGTLLHWMLTTHSRLVFVDGELRLMAARIGFPSGALLLRRKSGRWTATDVPVGWSPYVALAPLGGDTLVVAFLGEVRNEGNTLYARRFLVDGTPVGPAARLSVPEHGQVYDPQLLLGRDSVLYAVWTAVDAVAHGRGFIGVATSQDRGSSWRSLQPHPIVNAAVGFLGAAVDAAGALHITFTSAAGERPAPHHLLLRDERWSSSEPPHVPRAAVFGQPTTVFGHDGQLTMFWSVHDEDYMVTIPPLMLSSRGRMSCSEP